MAYSKRYSARKRPVVRRKAGYRKRRSTKLRTRRSRFKRTVKRGKFGSRTKMPESTKQLAVYTNPFSVATQQPKIPDGQRNFSLGTSFRSQIVTTTTTGGTFIVLFPGVQTFGAVWTEQVGNSLPSFGIDGPSYYMMRPAASGPITLTETTISLQTKELEGWRCVSAGLKIKCINNSTANEGMYQAIRLRQCNWSPTVVTSGGHYPVLDNVPLVSEWSNDPTYISGQLKAIGKHSFQLAVENNEHPFIQWDASGLSSGAAGFPFIYDTSYDIILINISGGLTTKLMMDGFQNVEQTFRAGTQLNYYQTQTMQVAPATLAVVQNKIKYKCRKA